MTEKKQKKKEKNTKKKNKIIPIIIGMIPGFIAGVALAWLIDWAFDEPPFLIYMGVLLGTIIIAAIAIIASIALHEAGHLVFGLMTGYKFSSYRIFSLMWLKDEKTKKIKLKRFKIAGTGGQCLLTPPDLKDGKMPSTIYNLGGVFTNVIIGLIFLVLFFIFIKIKILAAVMMIFALINITFAMTNGIPMSASGIDNDAKNAIAIKKNPEAMRAFWIQMKINEENSKGIRLKDMPEEWFTLPTEEQMQNSMIASLAVFVANRLVDEKRFDEADKLMTEIIDGDNATIMFYKQMLTCDKIYIELISECRSEVIENMLDTNQAAIMKAMKDFPSVIRTQYAYELLLRQDAEKANNWLETFEKIAKKYPCENEINAERELIDIATKKSQQKNQ